MGVDNRRSLYSDFLLVRDLVPFPSRHHNVTRLLLSFLGGLIIGIIYANVLQVFTESYEFPLREFVLGFVDFAVGIGMFAAGLLGLVVEPLLRQHCLTIADLAEYCFTRTDPNAAFNVTSSCHK